MENWKISQKLFHAMTTEFRDDFNKVDDEDVIITENVAEEAVRHFHEGINKWIYPSKSYVVAICYARWISEDFGGNFYDILSDPDLLYGNDPYFVPYCDDPNTYNEILSKVGFLFDTTSGMVPDIRKYYEEECHYTYS